MRHVSLLTAAALLLLTLSVLSYSDTDLTRADWTEKDNIYFNSDLNPEIIDMLQIPLSPEINEEVRVFAEVVDDDLDNVTLYYRVDNGTWSSVSMVYVSGLGFRGVIPGQSGGAAVDYYVVAYDVDGNSDLSEIISYYVPETTTTTTPTTTTSSPPPPSDILAIAAVVAIALPAV
ncbi:MAG: hypothetical protein ACW960_03470, partial [Candidatus Thorarchaeota archaeon]